MIGLHGPTCLQSCICKSGRMTITKVLQALLQDLLLSFCAAAQGRKPKCLWGWESANSGDTVGTHKKHIGDPEGYGRDDMTSPESL